MQQDNIATVPMYKQITIGNMELEISDYTCDNIVTYAKKPERVLSGDMLLRYVDKYYIPQLEVIIRQLNNVQYNNLMSLLMTGESIMVTYFDYVLGEKVNRDMLLSSVAKGEFIFLPDDQYSSGNALNMLNLTIVFESKLSYAAYKDLMANAKA